MGISSRLNTTATVKSLVYTAGDMGDYEESLTTSIAGLQCRISVKTISAQDRFLGDKVDSVGSYRIFTLVTTSTQGIKIKDVFDVSGVEYEVLAIRRPSRGAHLEFEAERIDDRS